MEQRRLRLGDILDDYCPRERRVTNHAVVAMVEEDVKQTRCTTCDAEHVYKGGKTPRKKRGETSKLYKQVLAGLTDDPASPTLAQPELIDDPEVDDVPVPIEVIAAVASTDDVPVLDEAPIEDEPEDLSPVHRPLIRAQLPRVEGVKLERQAPDFTIRQNNGRGGNGHFRGQSSGGSNGSRFGGGGGGGGSQRGGPFRGGPGGGGGERGRGPNQGFGRGPGGGNQPRQDRGGGGPRRRGPR
jgi:hypothetical protein